MRIYEYGPLLNINNTNKEVLKIITLAFLLVCNQHEILGHYNIGYQIYSIIKNGNTFDTPIIEEKLSSDDTKKRKNKDLGENIEIKLH